jgi:hypothetical protein
VTGPSGPTPTGRIWGFGTQWGSLFGSAIVIVLISAFLALLVSPWFWLGAAFGVGAFIALVILFRRTGTPPEL